MALIHFHHKPKPTQRVVVVGASGFVGGAVMVRLATEGIASVGLARKNVDLLSPDAGEKLAAFFLPTDCVVVAAAIAPSKSVGSLADNMLLLRSLMVALTRVRVAHIVNVSSDAVFPDAPVPLTETVLLAPGTLHGVMHLAREIAFKSELTAPLAIVRPTLMYGVNDPHNGYGPNRFRRLAARGEPIVLFGNGEELRDHLLVDDLAEVIVRIVLHRSTGSLNVATGTVHSFHSIAEMVIDAANSASEIKSTTRIGEMPHRGFRPFDIRALHDAFPDLALTALPDGLKRVQAILSGK